MLYDYLLTQFYPKIPFLVLMHLLVVFVVVAFYSHGTIGLNKDEKEAYKNKWLRKVIFITISQCSFLMFYAWIPDEEYVKNYYGEARLGQDEARKQAMLEQARYYQEKKEKANEIFLACLEKGQKQPHTTTFNDTNEVVKSCLKVSQKQS